MSSSISSLSSVFSLSLKNLTINGNLFDPPEDKTRGGNCWIKSGDEKLDALWLKGADEKPVFLYSHGKSGSLATCETDICREINRRGYGVLGYDYAGYGASTGKPSEAQVYLDVEAAYNFLAKRKRIPASRIIILGYSLGSGPSCYICTKHKTKALVLSGAIASMLRVAASWINVERPLSLPFDKFENVKRLKDAKCPVLIFSGTNDDLATPQQAEELFKAISGKKRMVKLKGKDHSDMAAIFEQNKFYKEVESFLRFNSLSTPLI